MMTKNVKRSVMQASCANELLTEESKRVLVGYHKIQMKREQLVSPAESAIIPLLDYMEEIRLKWKHAENMLRVADERAERFEQSNIKLTEELKERRNKERELSGQVSMLRTDKKNLEEVIQDQERRINYIKKTLEQSLENTAEYIDYAKIMDVCNSTTKTTFAKTTVPIIEESSEEAMDTSDEVKLRYNRAYRRSQSVEPSSRKSRNAVSKRTRNSQFDYIDEESETNENDPRVAIAPAAKRSRSGRVDNETITTVTTITMDVSGKQPTRGSIEVRKSGAKKRSVSASRILDQNSAQRRRLVGRSPRIANVLSNSDIRHKTPTGIGSSWTRGRAIDDCVHRFNGHRPLIGTCTVCNRQITFMSKNSLQCDFCKITVHEVCKKRAPVPCLPASSFPSTPNRNNDTRMALPDYCPVNPPYIPALLIRCICAIEKDRLNFEGIYRIPGNKEEVQRLYRNFSKFIPDLTLEPTEVITSCIKMFLVRLKEPLIPRSSYKEFMESANDDDRLVEAIGELPEPNRDTLAFLCLHFQKVAMNASQNKMTIENLAISVCPTILSNESNYVNSKAFDSTSYKNNVRDFSPCKEVNLKRVVLERLLKMPPEFWSDYLNARTVSKAFTAATPTSHYDSRRERDSVSSQSGRADRSVLGPVSLTPPQNFTPSFAATRRIKEPLF